MEVNYAEVVGRVGAAGFFPSIRTYVRYPDWDLVQRQTQSVVSAVLVRADNTGFAATEATR